MATTLPPPGADDVVHVIDLSGYVFRAYHAIQTPLNSPSGEPTHAVLGTLNMLHRMVLDRRPQRLLVAMDSRSRSFRKELYSEYKANRPPAPPDLASQMARAKEVVEAYGMTIVQKDGVEADDVIATVVREAREAKLRVVIVTSDKDLMQLVGDDVVLWDTMRNKVYGPPEVVEKLGVPPHQVRDFLALTGDSSDNVPGVAHVGPKTAAELLARFGTFEAIYEGIETIEKKKLKENLIASRENAFLSQRLVTLKDDVDHGEWLATAGPPRPDPEKMRPLFVELGFTQLLERIALPPASPSRTPLPPPPAATARKAPMRVDEAGLADFAALAHRSKRVALRIETTSPFAMRGEVIGVAIATDDACVYAPVGHRRLDGGPQIALARVGEAIATIFAAGGPIRVAHDGKREDVLLRRSSLPAPRVMHDTMLAAYLLDPETRDDLEALAKTELGIDLPSHAGLVEKRRGQEIELDSSEPDAMALVAGAWAAVTVDLAGRLDARITEEGLSKLLSEVELPLSETLADMELRGVRIDVAELASIGETVDRHLDALEKKAHEIAGKPFNVGSPRQLETLLFDELGLKPTKRTKTSRSTDAEVLEALADEHPLPGVILEHRQLAKLKGTYIEALPALVNKTTGRIHTTYAQAVAATGRISSNDPNLQNIPVRTEVGRAIRGAFVAPPGHVILSADYSQIELRVLAHLSRDPELCDAFASGADVHARTAMLVLDKAPGAVTDDDRRMAKTINFGVIYGMGDSALAKRLGIARKEAAAFIDAYFRRYAGVRSFLDGVVSGARTAGFVTTLLGRRRFVPDLSSANRSVRLAAERIAQNTPIQGTAADILKLAMVRLREPGHGAKMVLTVHDELVFEVPVGNEVAVGEHVRASMIGVVDLAVPLLVDVGWGETWAKAKG